MRGYGIVSAACVVVGEYRQSGTFNDHATIHHGMHSRVWGKIGKKVFTDDARAAVAVEVDKMLAKRIKSLRKRIAELEALTGEAVVAAAETKAKGGGDGEAC